MSNSTKRNICIAAVLFVFSVAGSGFMVYHVQQQSARLDEQITTLQKNRAQEQTYLRLQGQAEETQADRAQLQQYFLGQGSDSIEFLNLVERLAPQSQVQLTTNALQEITEPSSDAQWVEASFTFSGTRQAVDRFLQILETVPYVSRVTSVALSAQSGSGWQANVVMQVRVLNYDE
jgi:hypothetical protein